MGRYVWRKWRSGHGVPAFWRLLDSYDHYRRHVGLGRFGAMYRALYYEIRGKEPYA